MFRRRLSGYMQQVCGFTLLARRAYISVSRELINLMHMAKYLWLHVLGRVRDKKFERSFAFYYSTLCIVALCLHRF